MELPDELWRRVLEADDAAAVAFELDRRLHALAREALKDAFPAALRGLMRRETVTQGELAEELLLSADCVRAQPHRRVRRHGGGEFHIFDPALCVPVLVAANGGVAGYLRRLKARDSRKRKREDLDERREEARAGRRAAFDAWLEEHPLGDIASSDELIERLSAHGAHVLDDAKTLEAFLVSDVLRAPSMKRAKTAAIAWHAESEARAKRVADEEAAAAPRRAELRAALAALGLERRGDSRLCDAFERGKPVPGFETAARVAREMAFMRWLHAHTDYRRALRRCVEELRDDAEGYYEGINADARDIVKAGYSPPAHWPWLCADDAAR